LVEFFLGDWLTSEDYDENMHAWNDGKACTLQVFSYMNSKKNVSLQLLHSQYSI
jgi:hypothetical protein